MLVDVNISISFQDIGALVNGSTVAVEKCLAFFQIYITGNGLKTCKRINCFFAEAVALENLDHPQCISTSGGRIARLCS